MEDNIIIVDLSGQPFEKFEFPKLSRRKLFANRYKKKRYRVFPPKKPKHKSPDQIVDENFTVLFD